MSLENFRVFHEAVRLKSFRAAAAALNVAPSSVSRQIALLERQMGTALFDRSANGVVVTHAGKMVAEFARDALLEFDTLKADLDDYRGGRRAFIRIALVEGMSAAGPGGAIAKLHQRFTLVKFSVRMAPAPRVVELVKRGEVDIGITFAPHVDEDLRTAARIPEPVVLVQASNTGRPPVSGALSELASRPLALPSHGFALRALVDAACEVAGFKLNPILESDSFEVLRDFARAGGGIAVLPQRALRGKDNAGLTIAPITDRHLRRTTIDVVVLKQRRLPRMSRLFIDTLIEEISG